MFNVLNPLKTCCITDISAVWVLLKGRKPFWYSERELFRVKALTSLSTMMRSKIFTIAQQSAMGLKSHAVFEFPLASGGAQVVRFRRRGKSPPRRTRLKTVVSKTSAFSWMFLIISFEISSTPVTHPLLGRAIPPQPHQRVSPGIRY